jgi:hypothetical protein
LRACCSAAGTSTLTGGTGADWFFASLTDNIRKQKAGEIVTVL